MAEKLAPSVFLSEEQATNRSSVTAKVTKFQDLHGYLKKKSRHDRWQKRWFEANDHYLTYYKSPQSEKLLACIDLYQTGTIKLATESDDNPNDESHSEFSLELGDRFYIIKAETRGDAKRWVAGLNERKKPKSTPQKSSSKSPKATNEGRFTSFAVSPDGTTGNQGMVDAIDQVRSEETKAGGQVKSAMTKGDGSAAAQNPKGCGCTIS
mmetsp:Transcript_27244/g.51622  ORF Transcript_27244/g.51622 Transcript_27244/m.51622 type:complete len:209 (+) Transcript_27244:60-686(+)|eukprot:CAMPEP_0182499222 /NCGR_PEP_ID=MMETSP1321-20130603/7350_1 /TAXON_ID=91990 /ORGANISM="Bolidomonas sp., Strain RCC1657" /LENGTH=208 /DNA_ID=CAMNT_0024703379 /DNA_START=59 /DNA_END=685 /DNA_ORIENTATION=-